MNKTISILLLLFGLAGAQLSVKNLAEYQYGNLPDVEPTDLSTFYDMVDVDYRYKKFTTGFRFENFSSKNENSSYNQFAQRYVEWNHRHTRIRVGNFYTTIGRGLALRAFELPNVIFEHRSFRKRYGYYRDLDGALFETKFKNVNLTAFYGTPLNNAFPPNVKNFDRREGTVTGGQIKWKPVKWLMIGDGVVFTESDNLGEYKMNTVFTELSLNHIVRKKLSKRSSLKFYAEQARSEANVNTFFTTDKKYPHATYLAANFSYKRLGLSAEYKNYHDFENGVNLPPILYMEHSYYLLNRSTHELLAENETGVQYELTLRPHDDLFLLINHSSAVNEFPYENYHFDENFVEATWYVNSALTTKAFYDVAKDELRGELDRQSAGLNADWNFYQQWSTGIDFQYQKVDRGYNNVISDTFNNTYFAFLISKAPNYSFAVAVDHSTDPFETDDPSTFNKVEDNPKNWVSFVANVNVSMNHQLSLFYGSRRGGIACLSGSCYEVLPFTGLELRWIAHL